MKNTKYLALVMLLLLTIRLPAWADEAQVNKTNLPNGLTIITKEVHSAPVVAVALGFKVGSRNENFGSTGISHLLEHMLFKGTPKFPPGVISALLDKSGADFNAFTSNDVTIYYEVLPRDFLDLALEIESDRMLNSLISPEELKHEKTVVLSELEGHANNPQELLQDNLMAMTFKEHPYHWPVIGFKSDVINLTREKVYHYYKTYYKPNNAILTVVGDFNPKELMPKIVQYFGKAPKSTPPPPMNLVEPPQNAEQRVLMEAPCHTPYIIQNFHTCSIKNKDYYTLSVLSALLSVGKSSRFYKELVDTGLASSASSEAWNLGDPSLLEVRIALREGVKHQIVEDKLWAIYKDLQTNLVSSAELEKAKNLLKADFVQSKEFMAQQAINLCWYEALDSYQWLENYLAKVNEVGAADLQVAAAKYLQRSNSNTGWLVPVTTSGAGAAEENPAAPPKLSPEQEFYQKSAEAAPPNAKMPFIKGFKMNFNRYQLGNGLTLILKENHSSPSISLGGYIRAGSVFDPKGEWGTSNLVSRLLTRGTAKHSAQEINEMLDSKGSTLTFSAGREVIRFDGWGLKNNASELINLLGECLQQCTFPAGEVEKVKGQVIAALQKQEDSPRIKAVQRWMELAYPAEHPFHYNILGNLASVKNIPAAALLQFYHTYFHPENTVIIIAGDINPDQTLQLCKTIFAPWKAAGETPVSFKIPEANYPPQEITEVITMPGKFQEEMVLGHKGISRLDENFYAFNLMNYILGGSTLTGRLGKEVRDKLGYAYGIYASLTPSTGEGPWTIKVGVNPKNIEACLKAIKTQIKILQKDLISEHELQDAKASLINFLPLTLQSNEGLVDMLLNMEFYNLGDDYTLRYPSYYSEISREAIRNMARKYLHPDNFVIVKAGPYKD
jgi:zinc protease